MTRFLGLGRLGIASLTLHPLRSFLTALGIIIGVGAVIYMLAVIEGNAELAQEKIRARGSTNIILRARKPQDDNQASASRQRMLIYGLTFDDADRIRAALPQADVIVPVRNVNNSIYRGEFRVDTVAMGTVPWYPQVARASLERGRWFTDLEARNAAPAAVLGSTLAKRLFAFRDPLGETIRVGSKPFLVVGVLRPTVTSDANEASDRDRALYVPITSIRERFGARNVKRTSGSVEFEQVDLHELIVRVGDTSLVEPSARVIRDVLERFHRQDDYEVDVPLALLKEAERQAAEDRRLFGTVAGISLLVGGIGIMNIMLASVTERTREIGIRRALGALRKDITVQFLMETLTLAVVGGIVGVGGGIGAAWWHELNGNGPTIVTPFSILLSFGISALVGILAGLYPAMRAARLDPIEALRHE